MAKSAQIRDPIHGFIRLHEPELKLVGTRLFQRLRGIRQLAMANLVYPGALHTRFDHSLGVCHVAGLLAEQLGMEISEIERIRTAALLHDLGHGPFSHVSEHALERYAKRETVSGLTKKEKIHELVTAHFIQHDPEIANLLNEPLRKSVVELLAAGFGRPAARQIVSGPLDADKQDYLLRDSRFCGVAYGTFDVHQLHRSLVLEGSKDEEELMIDPDGVHAVEQYVLAKYYLTTSVYRHQVRLITDQMILRAIRLGIEKDDNQRLADIYRYDGSDEWHTNYARWDDAGFLLEFGPKNGNAGGCASLIQRLMERRLLKRVYHSRIAEFPDPMVRERLGDFAEPKELNDQETHPPDFETSRLQLEREVAAILSLRMPEPIDPDLVIFHRYTIDSVRKSSRNDERSIMVARGDRPRPFEEESALFKSISEGYAEGYVDLYAPVTWNTATDRKRFRRDLDEPIREAIGRNLVKPPV